MKPGLAFMLIQAAIFLAAAVLFRRELRAIPRKVAAFVRYIVGRARLRGRFGVIESSKLPLVAMKAGKVAAQTLAIREEVKPASRDLAALALALGHDPKTQRLEVLGGQWPALRVRDIGTNKPVRSYTFSALRRRGMKDANFAAAWAHYAGEA
jgi:hypothetical protein